MVAEKLGVSKEAKTNVYSRGSFMRLHARIDEHDKRLTVVEEYCSGQREMMEDIADIKRLVLKIVKYAKFAAPSLISAAIAAGVVNGEVGAFLNALFSGS